MVFMALEHVLKSHLIVIIFHIWYLSKTKLKTQRAYNSTPVVVRKTVAFALMVEGVVEEIVEEWWRRW